MYLKGIAYQEKHGCQGKNVWDQIDFWQKMLEEICL